jgi:hypothetical protein
LNHLVDAIANMKEQDAGGKTERIGKVVMGSVQGDIHDIGKDIVIFLLDANGFEVSNFKPPHKHLALTFGSRLEKFSSNVYKPDKKNCIPNILKRKQSPSD